MLVQQLVPNEPKWPPPASFQARAACGPWGRETGREEGSEGVGFKWSSLAHGSHERSLHAEEKHTYTRNGCRYRQNLLEYSSGQFYLEGSRLKNCFYLSAVRLFHIRKTPSFVVCASFYFM